MSLILSLSHSVYLALPVHKVLHIRDCYLHFRTDGHARNRTIIKSFVGCLAPCVGFRRWMVIPPMLEINGLGRLVSTLPLSLWCVGRIDFVVSDSHFGNFAFFGVCRFGFVFDGFVFELGERTNFRVEISLDFVFFGAFSAVGRPFYVVFGDFKGNPFAHYFLLVPRENRVFIEDYVATSNQSPVLCVP